MLAMADRRGRVWASVPGLANRARVKVEDARAAIAFFMAPDPDSRTKEHEGRRIEEIDGGWQLLNYEKYRAARDEDERRQYQREWDRQHRKGPKRGRPTTSRQIRQNPTESDRGRPGATQAEAEAEAEEVALRREGISTPKPTVGLSPDRASVSRKELRKQAVEILAFLNDKAGKHYQPVKQNVDLILGLLGAGVTQDDIRAVIAKKVREWGSRPEMEQYLRPATLFGPKNFHSKYAGEIPPA